MGERGGLPGTCIRPKPNRPHRDPPTVTELVLTLSCIDRKGIVRFYSTGFKPEEDADRLRARIEKMLKK